MAKLFIYQSAGHWAVGSSLHGLVQHLRAHGVSLEPSIPNLRGMAIRASLTNQMISPQTIIEGISLVPTYQRVRITPDGPQLVTVAADIVQPYEEALEAYISAWRARMLTILDDESSTLAADLSGGTDSRVVFAFLLAAGAAEMDPERFQLVSNRHLPADFGPAQAIAQAHGMTLNGPRIARRTAINHSAALDGWKHSSLGLYLPVYFVSYDFDATAFQAHGAGGGNYRSAYAPGRRPGQIDRFKDRFPAHEFAAWQERVEADLQQFAVVAPHVPADVMHYRQFRGRMHFGHRPHRRAMYTPLNAAGLDSVYDRPGATADRQVYFDIMESLAPGLMSMPYDLAEKSPSTEALAGLTRVDLSSSVSAGRVYASAPQTRSAQAGPTATQMWVDEAETALRDPQVRRFMGKAAVQKARAGIIESRAPRAALRANAPGVLEMSFALTVSFAMAG